jgi:flavin-dependent dehydrogenase
MDLRRVAVVGAGPAGLLAARLLRMSRPEASVTVFERQPAAGTYGFGVVLHRQATNPSFVSAIPFGGGPCPATARPSR